MSCSQAIMLIQGLNEVCERYSSDRNVNMDSEVDSILFLWRSGTSESDRIVIQRLVQTPLSLSASRAGFPPSSLSSTAGAPSPRVRSALRDAVLASLVNSFFRCSNPNSTRPHAQQQRAAHRPAAQPVQRAALAAYPPGGPGVPRHGEPSCSSARRIRSARPGHRERQALSTLSGSMVKPPVSARRDDWPSRGVRRAIPGTAHRVLPVGQGAVSGSLFPIYSSSAQTNRPASESCVQSSVPPATAAARQDIDTISKYAASWTSPAARGLLQEGRRPQRRARRSRRGGRRNKVVDTNDEAMQRDRFESCKS
jgi:hypothetical protein